MGSYAVLFYTDHGETQIGGIFTHKFFGYITDEECENMESCKYLHDICDIDVELLNESYIGQICVLTKEEADQFMKMYAEDFCRYSGEKIGTNQLWLMSGGSLPDAVTFRLCFG